MRAFTIVAAALLLVTALAGPATGDREHILSSDTSSKREHIL